MTCQPTIVRTDLRFEQRVVDIHSEFKPDLPLRPGDQHDDGIVSPRHKQFSLPVTAIIRPSHRQLTAMEILRHQIIFHLTGQA